MESQSPRLKILHVLTLNGPNGEYGGPVRVARELCSELNRRGHQTHIISGARKGYEPSASSGLKETFIFVKPLSRKLPISSLWSWKLINNLYREIRCVDLVHIHFARDLIPFLAAFISILSRKPFVTQTHGMIIFDGRPSTKFLDQILTRPLINRSKTNLVLTDIELSKISKLGIKSPSEILPNGIAVVRKIENSTKSGNLVAFCSRLEKRKGVIKFIDLADSFRESNMEFEIYGPDGGELKRVENEIQKRNLESVIKYKGAVPPDRVIDVLKKIDLLVLPSENEPFPMVILEALAVGTAVLVMPSCGLASNLNKLNKYYVSQSEDLDGLHKNLKSLMESSASATASSEIQEFCEKEFGISRVCTKLLDVYQKTQRKI